MNLAFIMFLMDLFKRMGALPNDEKTANPVGTGYSPVLVKPKTISEDMHSIHKWIEGERTVAYKDSVRVVTVGIGLTKFSDGSKPVFNRSYSADFLKKQYYWMVNKEKIPLAINYLESAKLLVPYNQDLLDVVLDLYFNGFHKKRADRGKQYLIKGKAQFANWLLTEDGMLKHFWNPKLPGYYKSRWGILKRAYWRANRVMGIKKSPAECEAWLANYRVGKAKKPLFY